MSREDLILAGGVLALSYLSRKSEGEMKYGQITLSSQRLLITAAHVTAGVIDIYKTASSPQGGFSMGGHPPFYEEWELLYAMADLSAPGAAGRREGSLIRIHAISGDYGGSNNIDCRIAWGFQKQGHGPICFVGPMIVPYGIFAEVSAGGFEANDVFGLVCQYRRILNE